MTKNKRPVPSLLELQSRGGDIAEGGFSFQDHVILALIPVWLTREGFTAMIKEAIGDVEAKFFVPSRGFAKELIEVKDHVLQPSEFWKEIKRFQEIDAGSPNTYRKFTLIGTGASKELSPLLNGLQRVQGPQNFYDEQDSIKSSSTQEYIQLVESKGNTQENALFLLEKVTVETDWNITKSHGEAIFKQTLVDSLEEYRDLSGRVLDDIYNNLSTFVRKNRNRCISRKELEIKLQAKVPPNQRTSFRPVLIYTATTSEDNPLNSALHFNWTRFSGGETRAIAPSKQWNKLLIELQKARTWIENHRNTKRISLLGNRRLSACLAIGSVFSAVRGFAIDMEYRGEIWATDAYPSFEVPVYPLTHRILEKKSQFLVVSIGICRNILSQVQADLDKFELLGASLLDIQGELPITSPEQANLIAGNIKSLIIQVLVAANSKVIHLFYAGPAHLALFLGHRLDATAPILCYGWTGEKQYSQTCKLFSGIASTSEVI